MPPWMIKELERQRRINHERRAQQAGSARSLRADLPETMWRQPDNMPAANDPPSGKSERGVSISEI